MTIKRYVLVAVVISAGLTVVLGWILFSTFQRVNNATEASKVANEIVKAVFEQNVLAVDFLLHREDRAQTQWVAKNDSLRLLLSQAERAFKSSNERASLDTLREDQRRSRSVFVELVATFEAQEISEELGISQELVERLATKLLLNSQEMVFEASRLARRSREEILDAQDMAALFVVVFVAVMATIIGGTISLIVRKVLKPISQLQRAAEIIGQGDLDYRSGITSRDELGGLSRAFDGMTGKLQKSVADLILSKTDLENEIDQRRRAEENIRKLNEELEDRVIGRTAELEAANSELEAFSYSISHDLRAPLRGMDGFSRILVEEFAPQLSDEAQHYLQMVRNNSQQMGHLVDDLLAFSRLGRQSMKMQQVSPANLVRQALEDLRAEQEGRRVEIAVGDLPNCLADPVLLKEVFLNLLGNALKYTRDRDLATIEVTSTGNGDHVYCVKDNGVGFDMTYADKLFGVFQRLHRSEDYEGMGVGLAIVDRIIHRHGGRVWAEAEVDKGATFYFTLGGGPTDG